LIQEIEPQKPDALKYYLEITGLTDEEFHRVLKSQRVGAAVKIED